MHTAFFATKVLKWELLLLFFSRCVQGDAALLSTCSHLLQTCATWAQPLLTRRVLLKGQSSKGRVWIPGMHPKSSAKTLLSPLFVFLWENVFSLISCPHFLIRTRTFIPTEYWPYNWASLQDLHFKVWSTQFVVFQCFSISNIYFFTSSTNPPGYFPAPIFFILPPLYVSAKSWSGHGPPDEFVWLICYQTEHSWNHQNSCLENQLAECCVRLCLTPRSLSTSRLSDMILKGAFGVHLFENRSEESLNCLKNIDGKNIHHESTHFSSSVTQQSGLVPVDCKVSKLFIWHFWLIKLQCLIIKVHVITKTEYYNIVSITQNRSSLK